MDLIKSMGKPFKRLRRDPNLMNPTLSVRRAKTTIFEWASEYHLLVILPFFYHISFFLEIFIYLCPNSSQVDVSLFEKNVVFLKELNERGYSLCYQSECNICGEITLAADNLDIENDSIKSIIDQVFPMRRKKIVIDLS